MNKRAKQPSQLWIIMILGALLLCASTFATVDANVASSASISFATPDGNSDYVGEGDDFATQVWATPWNFDEMYDLMRPYNLSGMTFEGGTLSAQIAGNDPHFFLLFPGMPSAINLSTGQQRPINADKYRRAAFHLCVNTSVEWKAFVLYWYSEYTNGPVYHTDLIWLTNGCQVVTLDLSTYPNWTGNVTGLRFDLEAFNTGDSFALDWFRLTDYPDWSDSYDIQWENLAPSTPGILELFLDTDNSGYDGFLVDVVTNPPSSGSVSWGLPAVPVPAHPLPLPQDVQPGAYYVYAKLNGASAGYSNAPIVVNQVPTLQFMNPSFISGRDYATDQGNPWDMDSSGTDGTVVGCTSHQFSGGQVTAYNMENDPGFLFNTPVPIDASFYRYLTIEFYSQYSFYDIRGGMSRLYWMNDYYHPSATEDLIINVPAQWRTYSLDLSQVPVEPFGAQNPWASNKWSLLRFDPNEDQPGVNWQWKIRDVKLTGPPEANTYFPIQWEIDNPENENVSLTLYYDTNNSGFDGIRIGQAVVTAGENLTTPSSHETRPSSAEHYIYLPLVSRNYCTGNCLGWNTSGIPNGEYYIYGCLNDGVNQVCYYSDVPVLITH